MKYLLDSAKLQCVGIRSSIDNSNGIFGQYYIMKHVTFAFVFLCSNPKVVEVSINQIMLLYSTLEQVYTK